MPDQPYAEQYALETLCRVGQTVLAGPNRLPGRLKSSVIDQLICITCSV